MAHPGERGLCKSKDLKVRSSRIKAKSNPNKCLPQSKERQFVKLEAEAGMRDSKTRKGTVFQEPPEARKEVWKGISCLVSRRKHAYPATV